MPSCGDPGEDEGFDPSRVGRIQKTSLPANCSSRGLFAVAETTPKFGPTRFNPGGVEAPKAPRNPSGNLGLSTDSSRDLIRVEVCALHPLRPSWLGASEESAPNDRSEERRV